ncbi:MAG: hypothetical protein PHG58_10450 [Clostridia bacterium]|nr:hypothetical protein [Clostridia bacterium]
MDKPWEGSGSGVYSVVFKDEDIYRMFYRAAFPKNEKDHTPCQGCEFHAALSLAKFCPLLTAEAKTQLTDYR